MLKGRWSANKRDDSVITKYQRVLRVGEVSESTSGFSELPYDSKESDLYQKNLTKLGFYLGGLGTEFW